jgi:sugar phosphate isomerase/epimerase
MLSMTTDYYQTTGCPRPYLKRIAEAGFSHVHWCHHWNTDFLYSRSEIEQIGKWLKGYGLRLLGLHASAGQEKGWVSLRESERQAGLELVGNRIEMTARLGGRVIVLHVPKRPEAHMQAARFHHRLLRSLDALQPVAEEHGVRIAIENMGHDDFILIKKLLDEYPPEYLGVCYDAGHGNLDGKGLDHLDRIKDRLISVHLHDNDGAADSHDLLFTGSVDWGRLAPMLASSSYAGCIISMESNMRGGGGMSQRDFLKEAFKAGRRFSRMIEGAKREGTGRRTGSVPK